MTETLGMHDYTFGYGFPNSQQLFQTWLPLPNYVSYHSPNIIGDYQTPVLVNIITGPGNTANLLSSVIECRLRGVVPTSWVKEATVISPTSDNSVQALFDLQTILPLPWGQHYLDLSFLNSQVGRTLEMPQFVSPTVEVPQYDIQDQEYNEYAGTATFTIIISPANCDPEEAGMQRWGMTSTGYFTETIPNRYDIYLPNVLNNPPLSFRDINDRFLYLLFSEDEFNYNISQRITLESSPESPQNVVLKREGDNIIISWDPVTDCTYSVFSSSYPYSAPASWNLEESGLLNPSWTTPVSGEKKFYFVKAIKIE